MSVLEFNITANDLIKITIAVVCGGLLGIERQYKNKTAGFRTIILICLGSTIYSMVAQRAGQGGVNINIVTGIGFIGAGVIFKDNISVSGLTTAAVIWISAAIGMAAGSGNYTLALICTVLTLFVLLIFNQLEHYVDKIHHDKQFMILFDGADSKHIDQIEEIVKAFNLNSRRVQLAKLEGCLRITLMVTGHRKEINRLEEKLLAMPEVISF